jgi:tRNA pseudouridine13 synthase
MDISPVPPETERSIGLEVYFTSTPSVGGKLKKTPDDFIVNEISDKPNEYRTGDYTIATVKVKNWETNRLIKVLARSLGISKRRIGFAGTKDKRAVTSQLMSFRCPKEDVENISIKDVKICNIYQSNRELTIGDLFGNDFKIRINDIPNTKICTERRIKEVIDKLLEEGGFPNFFGIQRFGSIRPITHLIGKFILKRDFKKAVMTYIANPLPNEPEQSRIPRERLEKEMDFNEAMKYYPKIYSFERSMIHHLSSNPEDWAGAIEVIPDNLRMMFIHAYQSFIFNKLLSERIRKGISLSVPTPGDLIVPLNKKNLPDHYRFIEVDNSNLEDTTRLIKKGLGYISGILMGNEIRFAGGEIGEIERKIVANDGIKQNDYDIYEIKGLSSKGIRREILSPIFDLKWKVNEKDQNSSELDIMFTLFRGSYATSLLREIMKGDHLDY